eukprot:15093955-Ditylum_brightwellii.AAC.1
MPISASFLDFEASICPSCCPIDHYVTVEGWSMTSWRLAEAILEDLVILCSHCSGHCITKGFFCKPAALRISINTTVEYILSPVPM